MTAASDITRDLLEMDRLESERSHRTMKRPASSGNRAEDMIVRYEALDRALVAKGFPATSPWWMKQVRRYFRSKGRQVVWRVGRRGGKSSTICRICVVEALCGGHLIPPGDLGVAAIISLSRDEAGQRLRTIKAILAALNIRYRPIDGGIELEERPVGFKVYAASIAGVSGFTGICIFCDEVAKWRDADTGANPATEVLASVRPTMATQPLAKIILSSSPLGKLDAHAAAFDAGETDFQITEWAPTWEANPTITEADTHKLEPDEAKWRREYGAIPLEGDDEGLFTAAMLDAVTRPDGDLQPEKGVTYVAAMDPAFTRNAWTLVLAAQRFVGEKVKRSIVRVKEWRGTQGKALDPEEVLREIASICRPYGVTNVYSDQYEKFGLKSIANRDDIQLTITVPDGTATDTLGDYESIWVRMADGEIDLHPDAMLRTDILSIRRKLTSNGFTVKLPVTPDGRHCDYAPSARLALMNCHMPPVPQPRELTPEQRLERLRQADRDRWKKRDEEYAEGFRRQRDKSWIENLEDTVYGHG